MLPNLRLAFIFAQLARSHGHKILHVNNADMLTRDLGDALRKQKDVLSDPRKGMLMTAYDVLPAILEVKILSVATAAKLGINRKGLSDIQVLEAIIEKAEERNGGKHAKDIKGTLEWTRKLFAHPEIRDVLSMEMTEIEAPKSLRGVTKFIVQLASRSQDELTRVSEFLRHAKDLHIEDAPTAQEPSAAAKKPAAKKKPKSGPKS